MNILDVQDKLKSLSEQQLAQEMQMPTGVAPQFLVLTELQRRKRVRDEFAGAQASAPTSTVAEEAVAAAGMPQDVAGSMARSMAPNTDVTQNTGIASLPMEPQKMAGGGMVRKMAVGGAVYTDPAVKAMANRMGVSVDAYLKSLGPAASAVIAGAEARAERERMTATEPPAGMASFQGVNPSYVEDTVGRFPVSGFSEPGPEPMGNTAARMDVAPPPAPNRDMTFRSDAIRAAQELGGAGGITDAMLASGMDVDPSRYTLDMFEVNKANARRNPPYLPGTAAATELNTPAIMRALNPEAPVALDLNGPSFRDTPINEDMPFVNPFMERTAALEMAEATKVAGEQHPEFLRGTPPTVRVPSQRQQAYEQGRAANASDPLANMTDSAFTAMGDFAGMLGGRTVEEQAKIDAERAALRAANEEVAGVSAEAVAEPASDAAAREAMATAAPAAPAAEPIVSETPQGGGSGGSGGVAAGGSGPMSDYEKELMGALQRTEKRAEQDKWLALAQAGMALMSSNQPTLGGALGEAGMVGLEQFRGSRDAAEKDRLGIMGTQYEMDMARQKMDMARAAAASGGGGGGLTMNQSLTQGRELLDLASTLRANSNPDDMDAKLRADEIEAQGRRLLGLPTASGARRVQL